MGNFISSSLGYNDPEEDLSLEKVCKLLENDTKEAVVVEEQHFLETSKNTVHTRTGTITQMLEDTCIIDDQYIFTKPETAFAVGSNVKYNLFISDDIFKVSNVELINNEWDQIEDSNSLWNTRIIINQVKERNGRILKLSITDIDLDTAPVEFLPIVGDWLELHVKCVVNEEALDLTGNIIEINKISPVRPHIELGKVTNWKQSEGTGTVNNKIFFNKNALSIGYIPVLGDKVVAEVIESEQNKFSWRAIKIIPESLSAKSKCILKTEFDASDYIENHPELQIEDVQVFFEKLGETKSFPVNIVNISKNNFTLISAEFLDSNGQCRILNSSENTKILSGQKYEILCECIAKNIGHSKKYLKLNFGDFITGKWINISVSVNHTEKSSYQYQEKLKPHKESKNELIRGQKGHSARFLVNQIPNYSVPQRLIDAVSKCDLNNYQNSMCELQSIKPSLGANLSHLNYEDRFHTLLHLDEIANLIAIRSYDQHQVCFIRNNEYLMLEIDNLSERRPSLIVGDKIIATDPMNRRGLDYEGFIHKVGARHVYIKFSQLFHDTYNGEDYSIKIIPGRSYYKRLHHGIYLATRNLGHELLFPIKLMEKDIQVAFSWEKDKIQTIRNGVRNSKMQNVLNKMHESKQNSPDKYVEEINTNSVKLEWYNKALNSEQKNAVMHILWGKARPLPYIIFGPPGTGKTVTIVETVLQILRLLPSSRLLVSAPSNSAADLIALRLINSGVLIPGDLVRVVSFTYALSDMIPTQLIPYCATGSIAKEDTTLPDIIDNTRGIQYGCNQATLGRHRITVATCSATGIFFSMGFPKGHFSHIIIDEAAQATEPAIMTPMSFLDKSSGQVVLAGDPMQLGPVILCKIAAECGLTESYLERIINRFPYVKDPDGFPETSGFDPRLVTKLLYNYRALPDILNLYNMLFYSNELIPTIDNQTSNEAKLLNSLKEILPIENNKVPQVVFHGVNGTNYQAEDSPSWYNPYEAAQVFYYVNELYRLGMKSSNIGIITPYIKQGKEIRGLLTEAEFELPKIGTIEEFQGQEFDVVLLSAVRSCQDYIYSDVIHSLGFVSSPKRLNVAISRAKSLLIMIGNPKLLTQDTYWRSAVKYCMENGSYTGCDF